MLIRPEPAVLGYERIAGDWTLIEPKLAFAFLIEVNFRVADHPPELPNPVLGLAENGCGAPGAEQHRTPSRSPTPSPHAHNGKLRENAWKPSPTRNETLPAANV